MTDKAAEESFFEERVGLDVVDLLEDRGASVEESVSVLAGLLINIIANTIEPEFIDETVTKVCEEIQKGVATLTPERVIH